MKIFKNFNEIPNTYTYIIDRKTQNIFANAKKVLKRSVFVMAKNSKGMVPEARSALDKFKMEAASEVGVNLKNGYNGDLTSREAGSVGGQMVKKMIESYEKNMK